MMKGLCLLLPLFSLGVDTDSRDLFSSWASQHGKVYESTQEMELRASIFQSNIEYIESWNAKEAASSGYTLAMNEFGDLTSDEFQDRFYELHSMMDRNSSSSSPLPALLERPLASLPESVDWRLNGSVTTVKNQGECGSCWSFSATGCMEGMHQLAGNPLVSLSEQQLIDCEKSNLGCRGGLQPNAFVYAIKYGMESEADYGYESKKDKTCKYDKTKVVATFSTYQELKEGDEKGLQVAVGEKGPISVGMDAGGDGNFQFYKSGVFKSKTCTKVIDHAVLAIGYGEENGTKYWLVKNSWGTEWGMQGYFKILRGKNMCGIAEYCSYIEV